MVGGNPEGNSVRILDGVHRIALAILRHPADAEDATQTTFLQMVRRLPSLRDPAGFPAWLHRIAVHRGLERLRERLAVRGIAASPAALAEALPAPVETPPSTPPSLLSTIERSLRSTGVRMATVAPAVRSAPRGRRQ